MRERRFTNDVVQIGQLFRHWKTNDIYTVVDIGIFAGEELQDTTIVSYTSGDMNYHRTMKDFTCEVKNDNGKWVKRFKIANISERWSAFTPIELEKIRLGLVQQSLFNLVDEIDTFLGNT